MSTAVEERRDQPRNLYRFFAFAMAIVVAVSTLTARMFYLQLVQGQQLNQLAEGQTTATQPIPSNRGLIYDAQGNLLVKNVVSYSVKIVPNDLPLSRKADVIAQLAALLHVDPVDITTKVDSTTGSLFDPVRVAQDVPLDVARVIEEDPQALPGVQVVAETRREYENGQLFGQLLGYTGPVDAQQYSQLKSQGYQPDDMIGKAGLEATYETQLRGQYGSQQVALDATGKAIPGMVTPISAETPGDSLRLTIDTHEQELAYKALSWGIKAAHVTKGVIVVENPQTGAILAMVSLPGYDDNLFAKGISNQVFQKLVANPDKPLVNKAISEQFAPGSTFKLITGTAGLQTGKITNRSTITSKPYVQLGSFKFWEWNHAGWGPLTIYQGFAHSSDTFFYQLAGMVGLDKLTYWAKQYGLGAPTGVDLPGEVTGIVPTNEWKMETMGEKMYEGELLQAGIGQGYDTVTPLQLVNAYSAMANGGNLYQPHLVQEVIDAQGKVVDEVKPTLIHKLGASAQNLQTMRLAARTVVTSRHTYNLVDMPIKVAGKTGTAEFGIPDKYGRLPYHQWFVGFVPGDPYHGDFTKPDSQLAVVAFVYGANTWGDTATEIVKYYLSLHYGLKGNPFDQSFYHNPWHVNLWAFLKTNFYGSPSGG
ncbi:MAG: penicillin-binding protein 2 [Candidatus Limnocylindrales bacterium]